MVGSTEGEAAVGFTEKAVPDILAAAKAAASWMDPIPVASLAALAILAVEMVVVTVRLMESPEVTMAAGEGDSAVILIQITKVAKAAQEEYSAAAAAAAKLPVQFLGPADRVGISAGVEGRLAAARGRAVLAAAAAAQFSAPAEGRAASVAAPGQAREAAHKPAVPLVVAAGLTPKLIHGAVVAPLWGQPFSYAPKVTLRWK